MGQYDRAIATVARLIQKYGGPNKVTWTVSVDGALPDATKPWEKGNANETPHDCYAVFLTSKRVAFAFQQYLSGGEIPHGKVACLIAGNVPFVPKLSDHLTRNGVTYSPEYIEPLSPGGVPLLYNIWFAK